MPFPLRCLAKGATNFVSNAVQAQLKCYALAACSSAYSVAHSNVVGSAGLEPLKLPRSCTRIEVATEAAQRTFSYSSAGVRLWYTTVGFSPLSLMALMKVRCACSGVLTGCSAPQLHFSLWAGRQAVTVHRISGSGKPRDSLAKLARIAGPVNLQS